MKAMYIYSACIVIETADVKVCCDPWFTDGIYEGSWYQYPKIKDPLTAIGKIDYVYISH
ncbi:MAG: MBL fold metallo-hydrolase, partial [Actinobacteria bacterium]|nr:MBL fold metallo-hydrolase [Actinomycetota bacterium]